MAPKTAMKVIKPAMKAKGCSTLVKLANKHSSAKAVGSAQLKKMSTGKDAQQKSNAKAREMERKAREAEKKAALKARAVERKTKEAEKKAALKARLAEKKAKLAERKAALKAKKLDKRLAAKEQVELEKALKLSRIDAKRAAKADFVERKEAARLEQEKADVETRALLAELEAEQTVKLAHPQPLLLSQTGYQHNEVSRQPEDTGAALPVQSTRDKVSEEADNSTAEDRPMKKAKVAAFEEDGEREKDATTVTADVVAAEDEKHSEGGEMNDDRAVVEQNAAVHAMPPIEQLSEVAKADEKDADMNDKVAGVAAESDAIAFTGNDRPSIVLLHDTAASVDTSTTSESKEEDVVRTNDVNAENNVALVEKDCDTGGVPEKEDPDLADRVVADVASNLDIVQEKDAEDVSEQRIAKEHDDTANAAAEEAVEEESSVVPVAVEPPLNATVVDGKEEEFAEKSPQNDCASQNVGKEDEVHLGQAETADAEEEATEIQEEAVIHSDVHQNDPSVSGAAEQSSDASRSEKKDENQCSTEKLTDVQEEAEDEACEDATQTAAELAPDTVQAVHNSESQTDAEASAKDDAVTSRAESVADEAAKEEEAEACVSIEEAAEQERLAAAAAAAEEARREEERRMAAEKAEAEAALAARQEEHRQAAAAEAEQRRKAQEAAAAAAAAAAAEMEERRKAQEAAAAAVAAAQPGWGVMKESFDGREYGPNYLSVQRGEWVYMQSVDKSGWSYGSIERVRGWVQQGLFPTSAWQRQSY
eukprot:TRINITY_DN689_c1_g2_i1.p1 TRINITY_DN689_c1_g2~~TRINITY_DN689_c1_g2_i1.p1  ORF type:complete len:763 (-),score=222.74 TRINITY_DN689_c1_g2_i1:401-2689(-)